jgi:hypothetical protein
VYHLTKDPVCIPQHGAAQEDVVIINRNVLLPRAHQFAAEGVEPVVGRLELEHSAEERFKRDQFQNRSYI